MSCPDNVDISSFDVQIVEYLHHATRGEAPNTVDSLLGETGMFLIGHWSAGCKVTVIISLPLTLTSLV